MSNHHPIVSHIIERLDISGGTGPHLHSNLLRDDITIREDDDYIRIFTNGEAKQFNILYDIDPTGAWSWLEYHLLTSSGNRLFNNYISSCIFLRKKVKRLFNKYADKRYVDNISGVRRMRAILMSYIDWDWSEKFEITLDVGYGSRCFDFSFNVIRKGSSDMYWRDFTWTARINSKSYVSGEGLSSLPKVFNIS